MAVFLHISLFESSRELLWFYIWPIKYDPNHFCCILYNQHSKQTASKQLHELLAQSMTKQMACICIWYSRFAPTLYTLNAVHLISYGKILIIHLNIYNTWLYFLSKWHHHYSEYQYAEDCIFLLFQFKVSCNQSISSFPLPEHYHLPSGKHL